MGKPSIFSRDYQKRMKRRRKIIAVTCIVLFLSVSIIFILGSGSIAKWLGNINKWSENQKKNNPSIKEQTKPNPAPAADNTKKPEEVKNGYDITLSSGQTIKAIYENNNGTKKFKYIEPVSSQTPYSINPSGNAMVIYDGSAQNIIFVDMDGKVTDITRKNYTAISDGSVYPKDQVLKNNPGYIWCASPAFVSDQSIVYISQLPWFNNQNLKYLWIVNISDGSHRQVLNTDGSDLGGQNIKIGSITDNGLGVTVDDKNYYIKNDGSVVQ